MHSSRMRTVRFSGRLRGVSARGGVVSAQGCGVCPDGVSAQGEAVWCLPRGCTTPPPYGQNY